MHRGHEVPISATFTLFKYFNLTPSVNYTERWYTRKVMKNWDDEKNREINTDTVFGFHRVYNYSASLGLSTKIYGMYKPLFAKKKEIQIRHAPGIRSGLGCLLNSRLFSA